MLLPPQDPHHLTPVHLIVSAYRLADAPLNERQKALLTAGEMPPEYGPAATTARPAISYVGADGTVTILSSSAENADTKARNSFLAYLRLIDVPPLRTRSHTSPQVVALSSTKRRDS